MTKQPPSDEPGAPKPHSVTIEGEAFPSAPKHIDYLPVETPAPGAFAEVAPGILWLRIPMPMDLNHINLWLLDEGDGWTLVDTGINADMAKAAWESIAAKAFADKPLKRIFLTHLHPDHIGLAVWLQERYRVPAWMSARGLELVNAFAGSISDADANAAQAFMMSHGFTDTEMLAKFFSGRNFRSGISGIPDVSYQPVDGEHLTLGGSRWQIYETNGHAEGHQCLFDAQRNILISGDQVLPTISPNVSFSPRGGDANPLNSFIESLERLSALDRHTLVLPSHGRPFFGLRARAADLIAHHREHLQAMEAACVEPKTAYDLVPVLFKRRLIGSHWMFAMGETIAHAEYLALAGKLARHKDDEGMIRYVKAGL
jgi:glyoxylase-like metal-dependent hydrolase (beta-lactamase superfamily II)